MLSSISEIATIQTGVYPKVVNNGDAVLLHVKHFDDFGKMTTPLKPDVLWSAGYEKHLLHKGDIVFAAKGSKNFATVIEFKETPCVASTSFFVLKIKEKRVSSYYLTWYLNTNMNNIKSMAKGTNMPSISKQTLADFKIPIPDLETQKKIVDLHNLHEKEKQLQQKILSLRHQIFQKQFYQILNKNV